MENSKKVKLDLTKVNGNAFAIMGAFSGAAKKQGWTKEEIKEVIEEATTGNYDHLLGTILKHTA